MLKWNVLVYHVIIGSILNKVSEKKKPNKWNACYNLNVSNLNTFILNEN